jgi:CBS domain-containing protein
MIDNKIDCIPVVEDDKELVGLITSMDLIDLLRERETLDVSRVIPWGYRVQTPETGYSGPG